MATRICEIYTCSCLASVITDDKNNFFLQQQQLMSAAKQKRKDSPYDRLRKRTVDSLDEMFR